MDGHGEFGDCCVRCDMEVLVLRLNLSECLILEAIDIGKPGARYATMLELHM
jgi:hypothetical protein